MKIKFTEVISRFFQTLFRKILSRSVSPAAVIRLGARSGSRHSEEAGAADLSKVKQPLCNTVKPILRKPILLSSPRPPPLCALCVQKIPQKTLPNPKNVCNFAPADRTTEAPVWGLAGRDCRETSKIGIQLAGLHEALNKYLELIWRID